MQGEEENFGLMKTLPKARRDFLASAIVATFLVVNGGSSEFAYAYDDDYERDTLALLEETNLYIAAKINYDDISKTYAKWSLNYSIPGAVDAKRFGKSFLLTTKIISLLKGGVNFEQKASDWVTVAIALTDGSLNGKEAREAYGNLVWANNDRSDPKNRIGLCAFGTTSGTDFFGIDCEGF